MLVTKDRIMTGTEARSFLGDIQARSCVAARERGPVLLSERFERMVRGLPPRTIRRGLLMVDIADALGVSTRAAYAVVRAAGWWGLILSAVDDRPLRWYPPWGLSHPKDINAENRGRVPEAAPDWWEGGEVRPE